MRDSCGTAPRRFGVQHPFRVAHPRHGGVCGRCELAQRCLRERIPSGLIIDFVSFLFLLTSVTFLRFCFDFLAPTAVAPRKLFSRLVACAQACVSCVDVRAAENGARRVNFCVLQSTQRFHIDTSSLSLSPILLAVRIDVQFASRSFHRTRWKVHKYIWETPQAMRFVHRRRLETSSGVGICSTRASPSTANKRTPA